MRRQLPILIAIGLVSGLFSALLGVGGGLVMVPLMLAFLGFTMRPATATSLGAVVIIAAVGVVTYALHGTVEPVPAALLGLPAAVGAYYGVNLQQRLPTRALSIAFAFVLLAVAGRMLV